MVYKLAARFLPDLFPIPMSSKSDRRQILLRIPEPLARKVEERAKATYQTRNDWFIQLLVQHFGGESFL